MQEVDSPQPQDLLPGNIPARKLAWAITQDLAQQAMEEKIIKIQVTFDGTNMEFAGAIQDDEKRERMEYQHHI